MASPRQVARWIVDDIVADLSDRRGLRHEWDLIDADIKRELIDRWLDIAEAYAEKVEASNDD